MGISTRTSFRRPFLLLGAAVALCSLTGSVRADSTLAPQAANAPYAAPMAKLQVTGSADKFTIDADHAEVQSVLKAIFNQANAQFTTDSNVVGLITMRLSGQPLPTTLDAVCKQLLLHYRKDARGIYVFEQDLEAVRVAVTRIKDLNALLRQQLRAFGLDVPEDSLLYAVKNMAVSGDKATGGASTAGGLGGGAAFGPGRAPEIKSRAADPAIKGPRTQVTPRQNTSRLLSKGDVEPNGIVGGLKYLTAQDLAEILSLNPQSNELRNPDSYRAFLRENGMVFINTGSQKAVVRDVLQELGRQSNTRVIIDPSVPTGPNFSLQGYITPRPLPEALNVLTQATRLTWRWLAGGVYVSALPDFQLFLNSTSPRVIYGNSAYPLSQNGVLGQQNAGGVYGQPSQTPLPITNGEKKTP